MGRGKQQRRRSSSREPRSATTASWQWPAPSGPVSLRSFKTACYEVARRSQGRVERISEGRYAISFHEAVLAYRDRRVSVLLHQTEKLLALADPPARSWPGAEDSGPPEGFISDTGAVTAPTSFIDDAVVGPPLAALLGARLLTAAELMMDCGRAATEPPWHLAYPQEMRYWKPTTVGQVIFNLWD